MIVDGLKCVGQDDIVWWIMDDCLCLIDKSGFVEYYDFYMVEFCGGVYFIWIVVMVIEILFSQVDQVCVMLQVFRIYDWVVIYFRNVLVFGWVWCYV